MAGILSSRLAIPLLLTVATAYATNHVAARVAFDHGTSVATGVVVRAAGTTLFLLALMRLQGVPFVLPRELRLPAILVGVVLTIQSYCLYSAIALIPAALALLVFQTSPMLFVLLSLATGRAKPHASALLAMPVALVGLALALDIRADHLAERWNEIGAGVTWAFAGAVCFALVLYSNAHRLKAVDGRLRTLVMTGVTTVVVLAAGGATGTLALPADATGWSGLALLTFFYGAAMTLLFTFLPRLPAASTVALNFEPIAVLGLGWYVLDQAVKPLQLVGAFIVVGAIVWLGLAKR